MAQGFAIQLSSLSLKFSAGFLFIRMTMLAICFALAMTPAALVLSGWIGLIHYKTPYDFAFLAILATVTTFVSLFGLLPGLVAAILLWRRRKLSPAISVENGTLNYLGTFSIPREKIQEINFGITGSGLAFTNTIRISLNEPVGHFVTLPDALFKLNFRDERKKIAPSMWRTLLLDTQIVSGDAEDIFNQLERALSISQTS